MEVKMSMEEYKKLEEARQDYEMLKTHIRECTEYKEEYIKNPIGFKQENQYRRTKLIAQIDLEKLTNVLQREIDFIGEGEDAEISQIIYKTTQGGEKK